MTHKGTNQANNWPIAWTKTRIASIWHLIVFAPLLIGCDAICHTSQSVELMVTRSRSSEPVTGAIITAAPSRHYDPKLTKDSYLNRFVENEINTGTTDSSGRARFPINTTIIKGGLFDSRDALDDRVTGLPYLLRIMTEVVSEIVAVDMMPGKISYGKDFVVKVRFVGKPTLNKQRTEQTD